MLAAPLFIHVDPNSRLGKFIIIAAIPLFLLLISWDIDELERSYESTSWPAARGRIIESRIEVRKDMHGISHSTPRIHFRYLVKRRRFDNDTIAFGLARGELTRGYAEKEVAKWPKGKRVGVRYQPNSPRVSCLEPGGLAWEDALALILLSLFACLGTKALFEAIAKIRRRYAQGG